MKPRIWKSTELDAFNQKVPVGSEVYFTQDDGKKIRIKTRSRAFPLGSGHALICLEGKSGGQSLDRVEVIEDGGAR